MSSPPNRRPITRSSSYRRSWRVRTSRQRPYIRLARQLGRMIGQMGEARIESLSVRYYGELATGQHPLIANSALVGLFEGILSDTVTEVNARAVARARGIDLVESSSTRSRVYRSLVSLQLKTSAGLRWLEGTCAPTGSRLVLLDGVPLEAPLGGTILLFENNDQPGVVGSLGTILAKHNINIANFSLGRTDTGSAVGAVQLDEPTPIPHHVLEEIRAMEQLNSAWLVRV